jgi:hypothetical protein
MDANESIAASSAILSFLLRPAIIGELLHSDITEQGRLLT